MCSDAVARGLGETVGVAFELNAGTELGVEGVVGVVGEVDRAAGLEALGIEVDKLVVANKGDVFDLDVGADVFDLFFLPFLGLKLTDFVIQINNRCRLDKYRGA